jgi:hypothetical protein
VIYLLPAYSPELNLIEILWRMIKYHWLPLKAYESFKDLMRSLKILENALAELGWENHPSGHQLGSSPHKYDVFTHA